MSRTLIKTDTAGWYEDPANPDKKVRKQNGDKIVTRAEYDQILLDAEDQPEQTHGDVLPGGTDPEPTDDAEAKRQQMVKDAAAQVGTRLTSGKIVVGQTIEIRCAWVDPDKRTPEQEAIFDAGFAGVQKGKAYEAVKDAAGGKRSAFPDGTPRTIKVQDAFQVRFAVENQKKWRAELRRKKNKARRESARAAAKGGS
jgi:hypothetical protein